MTNDTIDMNADLDHIKELHDRKRALETELIEVRRKWREAMEQARENGATVSDISRKIGVTAPNLFRVLRKDGD